MAGAGKKRVAEPIIFTIKIPIKPSEEK
jgi:hypothetical protein